MKPILLFLFLMPTVLNAQDVNLQWAKRIGGTQGAAGVSEGTSIAADASGNIYTTGHFNGTVDFDPGPGSYYLTGNGKFISKLNASGDFVWAKAITSNPFWGTISISITLDGFGNIYLTGDFSGTVDFDPGPSNFTLSTDFPMCFLVKLDVSGNFIWAKKMGKTDPEEPEYHVKTDAAGNIYIAGCFIDTADFDPGPGVYNLYGSAYSGHDFGTFRIFISKLDSSGNFLWAKAAQGAQSPIMGITGSRLFVDNSGNIYLTGDFGGAVDFDPGPGVFIIDNCSPNCINGTDIYIWKLNTDGHFVWVKTIGKLNNFDDGGDGIGLTVDAAGNIYSIGTFGGTLDFDPGPGVYNLTSPIIQESNYMSKLDSAGNFVWAKQIQSSSFSLSYTMFNSLALDVFSNLYITGWFRGTVDFDPGPGVYNLTDIDPYDKFILKLNSDGNFVWAVKAEGIDTSYSNSVSITTDNSGNIYTTGYFRGTVDFDPGTNDYNLVSVGQPNMFVDKLGQCANVAVLVTQPSNQQVCPGSNAIFSVTAAGATAYQWQLSVDGGNTFTGIAGATGSTYTITSATVNQNNYKYRCQIIGVCNEILSSSAVLTVVAATISAQPQNITLCSGSNHTFSVTTSGASGYQWQLSTDGGNAFNAIANANNSAYTLQSVTLTQQGYQYRCIVMSECDTIISSVAILSVVSAVSIVNHPSGTEICAGGSANFLVSANNSQSIFYQWQVSADGGINYLSIANGGIYSGATSSMLTMIVADASYNNYRYRCVLANAMCSAATNSNAAILTVRKLPEVSLTTAPYTSLFPWQSTTLTAAPLGSGGDFSTVWLYNNSIVPNTGNTRTVSFDKTGVYQVRIYERWPSDLVCTNRSAIVAITARDTARLIIYPNPNHGQFRISYYNPAGVSDLQVVTIYDSKGAMVYKAGFTLTGIHTSIDIGRLSLSAGFYSVVIADTNGKRLTVGKIIVY